jgi:Ca2+-transporting ATPase
LLLGLFFTFLWGSFQDPPRPEVHRAIGDCREAGIRVLVITGDDKNTAEAICHEIGVFEPEVNLQDRSFIGREFMALPDAKRREILRGLVVAGFPELNLSISKK